MPKGRRIELVYGELDGAIWARPAVRRASPSNRPIFVPRAGTGSALKQQRGDAKRERNDREHFVKI